MAGLADTVDFQLQQIFAAAGAGDQYLRINADLPPGVDPAMDCVEPENLRALKNFADKLFEEKQQAILTFLKQ